MRDDGGAQFFPGYSPSGAVACLQGSISSGAVEFREKCEENVRELVREICFVAKLMFAVVLPVLECFFARGCSYLLLV